MNKDLYEQLDIDFLTDKVVDARELVSMICAIQEKRYNKETLKMLIIDLIYHHANPRE